MMPVFCGNFEHETRQSDLERLFSKYGRVDMKSGFAFVYFDDEQDAEDAIRGLDNTPFGYSKRGILEDATKALKCTHMSKILDRMVSVEYALSLRDDGERGDRYSSPRRGGYGRRGILLMDVHQVQFISGGNQVLTMDVLAARSTTGTMVRPMTGTVVRIIVDIQAGRRFGGQEHEDTMMKFASFETIVEMLYKYAIPTPKDQCSKSLQLGISFAGGYVAGVLCAIVSHPADNLVSFLNNAKGATVGDAVKKLGLWGLFTRGLPLRIVMIGTLTGAQWGIYDAFKVFVGLPTTGGVAPAAVTATEPAKV
ncbi:hypothetical protein HHK36_007650 [Tetracentron sinense]|uniref:RRM domain-containing protein n=1 Tax=Tetracentron sinense TaxID=13715 RepID=A0A834ZNS0_TETSI|nr:hypothetical protein HHK36_007628 [Tetracentron sinense]KAF8408494.1 hypothetical protein HHK36_007650 [Tetracentron sinense]